MAFRLLSPSGTWNVSDLSSRSVKPQTTRESDAAIVNQEESYNLNGELGGGRVSDTTIVMRDHESA